MVDAERLNTSVIFSTLFSHSFKINAILDKGGGGGQWRGGGGGG